MTEKKLFRCYVQLEVVMAVAADTEQEARAYAEANYQEEADNIGSVSCHAEEMRLLPKDPDLLALPWGVPDNDPRRDWTCERWLKEQA